MIWLVYRKELLETLRDRRTLVVMILLPLALYPLLGIGVSEWLAIQHSARGEQISSVALAGAEWPALRDRLTAHRRLQVSRLAGEKQPAEAISQGLADLVLRVPEGHEQALTRDGTVELTLTHDQASDRSKLALRRARGLLGDYADEVARERLARHNLPVTVTKPLKLTDVGIATTEQVGSHLLAGVLPVLVVLMVLLGAFYPAIDLTAGEKERGTLETLLCSPVPRMSLIGGKFLVVATVAAITGLLNLGSLGLTFALGFSPALEAAGVASDLPWAAIAMTVIGVVPAALFFAAVMIAIAALAHSFKEAQTLLTPVYLICMVPAMLVQLPGVELNIWTAVLPAVNIALLVGELIGGRLPWVPTLLALVSSCVYAAVALGFAARIYNSERLLFSERSGPGWFRRRRPSQPRLASAEPAHAAVLLLTVIVLIVFVGRYLQARSAIGGILATEWLLIALPVALLVWLTNLDPRRALALRAPPLRPLLGAVLAGLSGWYVVGVLVEGLQQRVMPMPPEMAEQARRMLFSGDRPLALDLFALAVSPAICEELLFRGVLLSAALGPMVAGGRRPPGATGLGVGPAVLLNAVLFGVFHLSIYRLLPTMLLGVVLALLVVRTGSLWVAVVFHLLNNAATVLAGRLLGLSGDDVALPGWYAAIALACFVAGLALALHRPAAPGDDRRQHSTA